MRHCTNFLCDPYWPRKSERSYLFPVMMVTMGTWGLKMLIGCMVLGEDIFYVETVYAKSLGLNI